MAIITDDEVGDGPDGLPTLTSKGYNTAVLNLTVGHVRAWLEAMRVKPHPNPDDTLKGKLLLEFHQDTGSVSTSFIDEKVPELADDDDPAERPIAVILTKTNSRVV